MSSDSELCKANHGFPPLKNDLILRAARGQHTEVTPVWTMRQAGRYHQHYQKLRKENSFMDLCKKPKLAAEVALGPIEEFDFDIVLFVCFLTKSLF